MIFAMKRARNSRWKELKEALEIMVEMKTNSNVNVAMVAKDGLKIQIMRNETYFQYVLADLDGKLMDMPVTQDDRRTPRPRRS